MNIRERKQLRELVGAAKADHGWSLHDWRSMYVRDVGDLLDALEAADTEKEGM